MCKYLRARFLVGKWFDVDCLNAHDDASVDADWRVRTMLRIGNKCCSSNEGFSELQWLL